MSTEWGSELTSRGCRNLRFAVAGILALSTAAQAGAADPPAKDTGDRVVVHAPPRPIFAIGGGGGSGIAGWFDTQPVSDVFWRNEGRGIAPGSFNDTTAKVCRGNPVSLSNQNKVEHELDFRTNDVEMPLEFSRLWNANRLNLGGNSYALMPGGWSTSLDSSLFIDSIGEKVTVDQPDGRQLNYQKAYDGAWRAEGAVGYVALVAGGLMVHYTEDGVVETYESRGHRQEFRLRSKENRRGIRWSYAYGTDGSLTSVTHSSGKRIDLWRSGATLFVRDPAGNVYAYLMTQGTYGNLLSQVTFPGGLGTVQYHYAGVALLGKSFDNIRYSYFGWDEGIVSTEHAGGVEKYAFVFNRDPDADGAVKSVEETNPLGLRTTYEFSAGKLLRVTGHPSTHCGYAVSQITYDSAGRQDIVTDYANNSTDYDYDPHGHLTRKTEGVGTSASRITTYEWDETNNLLTKEALVGLQERIYQYTGHGRPASVTVRDLSGSGYADRVTTYSYVLHANGTIASTTVDGPIAGSADAVTSSYTDQGHLSRVSNGAFVTTYSGHNGLGLPGQVISETGEVTDLQYDARGRVSLVRTYPNGAAVDVRFLYDTDGQPKAISKSDGSEAMFHYDDARRLIQEDLKSPDGGFEVRRTFYNALSKPIRVEVGRDN